MNFRKGMFRLWSLFSVACILFAIFLIVRDVQTNMKGAYQVELETRANGNPWDQDWEKKSFRELFFQPSELKKPPEFPKVESQYIHSFEDAVRTGNMEITAFPDGSELYVSKSFTTDDKKLLGDWFWHARWHRRFAAASAESGALLIAFGPPLFLLALWHAASWVFAGFKHN